MELNDIKYSQAKNTFPNLILKEASWLPDGQVISTHDTIFAWCAYPVIFSMGGTTDRNIDICCDFALRKVKKFINNYNGNREAARP